MNLGDLVRVAHPGGLFGPNNNYEVLGVVVEPPNEVSIVKIYWFCGNYGHSLPSYIHVEEVEVVRDVKKN